MHGFCTNFERQIVIFGVLFYIGKRLHTFCTPFAHLPESGTFLREVCTACFPLHKKKRCYGFTDGEEHPLIGTAIYFHLTKGRAQKTEEQAMENLWLELPWWFD